MRRFCVLLPYTYIINEGGYTMAFKIPKEEYINRTFRLRKELVDRMEAICNEKNISLNKLTVLCIEYALDSLEEEDSPDEKS